MGADQGYEDDRQHQSTTASERAEARVSADEQNVLRIPKIRMIIEAFVLAVPNCNVQAEVWVVPEKRFHMPAKKGNNDNHKITFMEVSEEKEKLADKDIDFRSYRISVIMDKDKTPGADKNWGKNMKGDVVVYNPDFEVTEKQRLKIKVCNADEYNSCKNDRAQGQDSRSDVNFVVVKWDQDKSVSRFMIDGEEYELKKE